MIQSKEELVLRIKKIINIPFGKFLYGSRNKNNKGSIGQMIEESCFDLKLNSKSEADFENLNIELKVTPFVKTKSGFSSKERLVLNVINYETENLEDFYKSTLWKKNKTISILFYEHRKDEDKEEWYIDSAIIFNWIKNDMKVIQNDWKIIVNKIKSGLAHEISERDTMYLAACTKGSTAESSYRKQPFSTVKAKQRAYSLKSSYMSYILNNCVYSSNNLDGIEKISKQNNRTKLPHFNTILFDETFNGSIQEYILHRSNQYIYKSTADLVGIFKIKHSKSTNASIINSILNTEGNIKKLVEFQKAGIIPKTIVLEDSGKVIESMSFPTFRFEDVLLNQWEESDFYNILNDSQFMFCVFKKNCNENSHIFLGIYFWSMPFQDIEKCRAYYNDFQQELIKGVKLINQNGKIYNSFPKKEKNGIIHARPHASKSCYRFKDVSIGDVVNADTLPNGDKMTKHCFWLNNSYIQKVIATLLKNKQ